MGRNDNLVSAILSFFIVCIFLATFYFCLDVFGIIEVPEQYSIAQFFATQNLNIYEAQPIQAIVDKDNIDDWMNEEQIQQNSIENITVIQNTQINNSIQEQEVVIDRANKAENRMYYSQLDVYGRIIYDEMYMHIEDLKTGTYVAEFDTLFNDLLHEENGEEILENAFQFSLNALLFDNPEIFYIDITKMYMSTQVISFGPLKTYRVEIGPLKGENYLSDGFQNITDVQIAINKIESVKNYIKGQVYGDIYNQIKIVHDYIISNTSYDETLSYRGIYTAYGVLEERRAVCEGYSKALKYLLDDLGIPCIIVCGIAQNSNGEVESHAWNYVKIDEAWYAIDCTWDDPVIIGNGHVSPSVYKKYLLKGSLEFFIDHYEDGNIVDGSNFIYPTISKENYR